MQIFGLLGQKLGHSYSPIIHQMLGTKPYMLFEKQENELASFLSSKKWTGLNVTIPYKKTVFPFIDFIGETARKTGSINTLFRDNQDKLIGENTDVYGFYHMIRRSNPNLSGKKVFVLGNGGACPSVCEALRMFDAQPTVISRKGENHYGNLNRHKDAAVIVNTTPLGMYPKNGQAAVDLRQFPKCEGVFDLIYNPSKTALLLQAEQLKIPCENGLYMLVAQAKKSAEFFTGQSIDDSEIDRIYQILSASVKNIILIGMPGCGKTTTAKKIATMTGRTVYDSDDEIFQRFGQSPESIIRIQGEEKFRAMETEILSNLGKKTGAVIATGGGAVTRPENYPLLHQNGTIVWLQRSLSALPNDHRPLSQKNGVETLYKQRAPLYRQFADVIWDLDADPSFEILLQNLK